MLNEENKAKWQTVVEWGKKITKMLVWCGAGAMITICTVYVFEGRTKEDLAEGYKQGQVDYYNKKIKWKLVDNLDSSRTWQYFENYSTRAK